MPNLSVFRVLFRELTTSERIPRVAEPDLVMDDPAKVAAYVRAGAEGGVMAPVYLYHCHQICEVIRPGDVVLDLACGPATELAMIARLNPDVHFVGVDLSEPMLVRARAHVSALGLSNVELRVGDITHLAEFADDTVDAVMSTMALHHLPDATHLDRALAEVARVLTPGGGVYLADFGRLRAERSIRYFADRDADSQPELFTLDYLHSLRAAFSLDDFRSAARQLDDAVAVRSTFGCPFMVALKSAPRRELPLDLVGQLAEIRDALPTQQQADFADLTTFFRFGGLRMPRQQSLLVDHGPSTTGIRTRNRLRSSSAASECAPRIPVADRGSSANAPASSDSVVAAAVEESSQ